MEAEDLFNRLPEGCISEILSFTSPRDVCRFSAVCKVFRSASESDVVWERFLPSDYPEILAGSVPPVQFTSKKELFFRLCDSILIDDGQMSLSIEKMTCRKVYMLSGRKLDISLFDTPIDLIWFYRPESRFSEVVELLNVCWSEIRGKIDSHRLSPKTTYKAFLVLKSNKTEFGMRLPRVQTSVKLGGHAFNGSVLLHPIHGRISRLACIRFYMQHRRRAESVSPVHDVRVPKARSDGWLEVEIGEFFNDEGQEGDVEMGLMEVHGGFREGGLIIEGIEIRPV